MTLDYTAIATGMAAPVAVLLVKSLLDFSLSHSLVKYFWWVPVRSIFRNDPHNLQGTWEQTWGSADSPNFKSETDRHSHLTLKQFGHYCYGEYIGQGVRYALFGKIKNDYLCGEWYDKKSKNAYFGTFQLFLLDAKTMEGKYLGHSCRNRTVQESSWNWKKIDT